MKRSYLFIIITLAATLTSCKKYLDIKSDKSLVVPNTLRDLQALLDDAEIMNQSTPVFGEASSDDYFLPQSIYNGLFPEEQKKYTWIPHDYYYSNDWSMSYMAIYPTNICIEQLQKIERTPDNSKDWDNVKGSAHFLRAYHFFQLASLFALAYEEASASTDLGIVLRTTSDFNIKSSRASVKETYNQIINDAKEASYFLVDKPAHPLRPSKAAAFALLARTYLTMKEFDSSGKYARLCLGIKGDLLDYNNPSSANLTGPFPFRRFNVETLFYSTMNNALALPLPLSGALIDTSLYGLYEPNDLRKQAFFEINSNYPSFKGTYSRNLFFLFSGIAIDEVYLLSAECYARKGQTALAMQELNTLLSKRYSSASFVPISAGSSEEAIQIILKERRKELVMRGLRWLDIKRLNKAGSSIVIKRKLSTGEIILNPNDKRYALSIPADVIREAGIPQN